MLIEHGIGLRHASADGLSEWAADAGTTDGHVGFAHKIYRTQPACFA